MRPFADRDGRWHAFCTRRSNVPAIDRDRAVRRQCDQCANANSFKRGKGLEQHRRKTIELVLAVDDARRQ
ncbi:hypothetical protein RDWZM_005665 [Blomia tropicalis]|uniref:Uncharacterized protein n=1 Tax=Blomia tropicalis TaxID=40697 RepID=A0A9Q0M770_BLOTA|nr:hypothetical protein RDWZM_005665 [Blomia tropicalis]